MEEKGKKVNAQNQELVRKIKSKRYKKIALIALAAVVIVSTAVGLSIEGKDAKLADGQGNIVLGENVNVPGADDEKIEATDQDKDAQDTSEKDDENAKEEDKQDKSKDTKASSKNDSKTEKTKNKATKKYTEAEKKKLTAKDIKVDNSKDFTASNNGNAALKPAKAENVTVTLEIRCDTLSNDMSKLENSAIKDYIPQDGVILKKTTYKGTTDNTVFDALNTLCRNNDIQLEFSYTPVYASYYIEGINYLYEFDGGPQSGWMYKVNGWFPNYGCSSYYLKDGDTIVRCYTCEGLGTDVGADEWMG